MKEADLGETDLETSDPTPPQDRPHLDVKHLAGQELIPGTVIEGFRNLTDLDIFSREIVARLAMRMQKIDPGTIWPEGKPLSERISGLNHVPRYVGAFGNYRITMLSPDPSMARSSEQFPEAIESFLVERDILPTGRPVTDKLTNKCTYFGAQPTNNLKMLMMPRVQLAIQRSRVSPTSRQQEK